MSTDRTGAKNAVQFGANRRVSTAQTSAPKLIFNAYGLNQHSFGLQVSPNAGEQNVVVE